MISAETKTTFRSLLTEYVSRNQELRNLNETHPDFKTFTRQLNGIATQLDMSFGERMEEVLTDAYDEYCPDNEISHINEYLKGTYFQTGVDGEGNITYDFASDSGVKISVDEYEGQKAYFVINPNPVQLVLDIEKEGRKVIWTI